MESIFIHCIVNLWLFSDSDSRFRQDNSARQVSLLKKVAPEVAARGSFASRFADGTHAFFTKHDIPHELYRRAL